MAALTISQLQPYEKAGWLVKEGGFVPSWKTRYFILKVIEDASPASRHAYAWLGISAFLLCDS